MTKNNTVETNQREIGTSQRLMNGPVFGYVFFWVISGLITRNAARDIFFQKGLFDFNLLISGILALFLSEIWAPFLVIVSVVLDILAGFASTYYFQPQDILYAIRSLGLLPARRLFLYGCIVFIIFTALGTCSYFLRRSIAGRFKFIAGSLLLFLTFIMLSVDAWNGHRIFNRPDTIPEYRLVRVSESTLLKQEINVYKISKGSFMGRTDQKYTNSASERGLALIHQPSNQSKVNIVEILVESWGIDNNATLYDKFLANYHTPSIANRYQVLTGTVPFWGPTVSGEIRELCHSALGFGILQKHDPGIFENCLPQELRRKGYQTEAVHGYFGGMFDRSQWYPLIGFNKLWFWNSLHHQGLKDCTGAFPGTCDEAIAGWITSQLNTSTNPIFLYWVTLNSHLPLPTKLTGLNPVSCGFDPQTNTQESLCAWFKLQYEVHQSIANLASSSDIPTTAFFIVGDHSPPFADPAIRQRFSNTSVPYILLIPKDHSDHF